jgi:hypothetical protein
LAPLSLIERRQRVQRAGSDEGVGVLRREFVEEEEEEEEELELELELELDAADCFCRAEPACKGFAWGRMPCAACVCRFSTLPMSMMGEGTSAGHCQGDGRAARSRWAGEAGVVTPEDTDEDPRARLEKSMRIGSGMSVCISG